nr:hypothetical protein [Candidatus Freyarchaeota archaeon]
MRLEKAREKRAEKPSKKESRFPPPQAAEGETTNAVLIQPENEGGLHRQHKQNAGRGEIKHRGGFRNSGVCPNLGVKLGGGEVMHIFVGSALFKFCCFFCVFIFFGRICVFRKNVLFFCPYYMLFLRSSQKWRVFS